MDERLHAQTVVDGRYEILHRLGSGGMADVYCATDLQLGRKVALKMLYRRFAEDQEFVERFRREASSAAGLQHQHVVSVYDRGEWDGTYYIAMEYLEGRSLKQVVLQEAPLAPARAIDLVLQVLRAARFAHKRGIIHRDLKPHNVIVDGEERATVTDFGIARAGASDMTQTGSIMGTAQYLSPEQAQGHSVGASSDLYSIGIILYELLTGRVPFDGDSAVTIALKQVSEAPLPPSRFNAAVTPELEAAVLRALEKDPARRYADADEFIVALESARAGLPAGLEAQPTDLTTIAAPPPAEATLPPGALVHERESYLYPPEPLAPPEEREGGRWWLGLLAALLVAGLIVAGLLLLGKDEVEVPRVVGAQQSSAEIALRNAGFEPRAVPQESPRARGIVIGQDPGGGEQAEEGSTVTITVSSGPGQATIPSVDGRGRRAARRALREAGFKVRETERADADVPKDRVIGTSPGNGEVVDKGTTVEMFVSTGPESASVPSVVGQKVEDATAMLEDAGFTVRTREQESDKEPGTVLQQDPAGGTSVAEGSRVTLTVAKESSQIEVPDVTGLTRNEAVEELSGDFRVRTVEQAVDTPDEDGVVLSQDPAGGAKAKRDSRVTITVGRFNPDLDPEGGEGPGTTPEPGAGAPPPTGAENPQQ
ncbi:MAG: Stk1 family PASTA domain-containing Ser/Thr kinase [Actinomycetota bacterium]|nr:Stk1 family PASTA domain-containing Ser/Thr kinase [Actinomycetota bacterium]